MSQTSEQTIPDQSGMKLEGKITVMPQYYLPKTKKEFPLKKLIITGAVVVFLGVVVAVSLLFIQPAEPPIAQQSAEEEMPPASEAVTPPPAPQPEAEQPQEPEEDAEAEEPEVDIPSVAGLAFEKEADTDQDGLTDIEEQLFGTSAAVPDTDNDSFLDGAEVVNLYDPAAPGALLEVSPRIKIARNEVKGYQLLIPADWTAAPRTPAGNLFEIFPDQGTDSISITVYENEDRLQVVQWYQQNAGTSDLTNFVNFKNEAGWAGIQSLNQMLVIATYGETGPGARAFIFMIHYDLGEDMLMRYPTIWDMMVNSLAVYEPGDE